ncbi:MAG TPA: aspartate racemase [Rikenellaceae bacterium]|nr:MAG: aspartate racemase [Bacteroidetes bacterium GWE2_40_15]HBZ26520.1 aspartate racemase [Rikenellaceae bacterium]
MKIIGLIGGMSWESTLTYYKIINEEVKRLLGGFSSARCIIYSVNFDEIEKLQRADKWEESGRLLNEAAKSLERAGADLFILCTNTMHKVGAQIVEGVNIPFYHIAEMTANEIVAKNIGKIALLGTIYTMEGDFYKSKLIERGLEVIVPEKEDRETVNRIIFGELCMGRIEADSRQQYLNIISKMVEQGAQGVILGCTEIGLLINRNDLTIPVFDTTIIHAKKAVEKALESL